MEHQHIYKETWRKYCKVQSSQYWRQQKGNASVFQPFVFLHISMLQLKSSVQRLQRLLGQQNAVAPFSRDFRGELHLFFWGGCHGDQFMLLWVVDADKRRRWLQTNFVCDAHGVSCNQDQLIPYKTPVNDSLSLGELTAHWLICCSWSLWLAPNHAH